MVEDLLVAGAIGVGLFLLLKLFVLPFLRQRIGWRLLLKKGLEADAVVLSIKPTGTYIDDCPQVCLLLTVKSCTGKNFVAEARQVISAMELSTLRAGTHLKVKYNPRNVKEVTVML